MKFGLASGGMTTPRLRQQRGVDPSRPDPKKVKEYAKRFQEALDVGLDQAVIDIHEEIVADEAFYREAWAQIPGAPARRALKKSIARGKESQWTCVMECRGE